MLIIKKWSLVLLSVLVGTVVSAQCHYSGDEKPVILVVGDSLSAAYGIDQADGWVALLEQRLNDSKRSYQVINASVSGDTTSGGLAKLPRALKKFKPELVIIELGGNDGLRGIPLATMSKNLKQMVELSINAGAQPVLLGMHIPSNYGARYGKAFHRTYSRTAQKFDLPFKDFFLDGVALDPKLMQADGIHPNSDAQPKLLENAWPVIEQGIKMRETVACN